MKITYDNSHGQAYIYLMSRTEVKVARTIEVQRNVLLDFDSKGEVIGIELIGHTLLDGLKKAGDVEII